MYLKGLLRSFSRFMHPSIHCVRWMRRMNSVGVRGGSMPWVEGQRAHVVGPLRHLGMLVSCIGEDCINGLRKREEHR